MGNSRSKIVVADDEIGIRLLIAEVLEEAGFEVLEAWDGTEAVRLIKATPDVDLVITDINMPGLDGFAVSGQARVLYPKIPILFVSGRYNDLAEHVSIDDYQFLQKPFHLDALLGHVRKLLPPPGAGTPA